MPTVAIVEDHQLMAETLRATLAAAGVSAAIVVPDDLDTLVPAVRAMQPTLVLLDLMLGDAGDGIGIIAPLTEAGLRVLVVTGTTDREQLALAYEAGAFGVQSKADGFDALLSKVFAALDSDTALDADERSAMLVDLARLRAERDRDEAPFRRLTRREQATLAALSEGRTVTQIADDWVVSEATVRSHVRAVLGKLDAPSQLVAATRALRSGWFGGGAATPR